MKKIGILRGMEDAFPEALIDRLNSGHRGIINADFVEIGGVPDIDLCRYAVILDRISHDIPFYRAYLKNAARQGCSVINDPFRLSSDDKFLQNSIAMNAGIAVPHTVLLPSRDTPKNTTNHSMRNLAYPLDWESIFAYVGFPAFLKPFDGGGWRDVFKVHNETEFLRAYSQSGTNCMMLQQCIRYESYFRCFCIGRRDVLIMSYNPENPAHLRYSSYMPPISDELEDRLVKETLLLNELIGYDFNTVEFAIENGIPYAIDFMNPVPDCDPGTITRQNFSWVVDAVANFLLDKASGR